MTDRELRATIRKRFTALRVEVQQRRAELIPATDAHLSERHTAANERADEPDRPPKAITDVADRKAVALLRSFDALPDGGPSRGRRLAVIDGLRDPEQFRPDMDKDLRAFKDFAKAPGQDRIYVAGDSEVEKTAYHREHGVPVHVKVWDGLQKLASELNLPFTIERT